MKIIRRISEMQQWSERARQAGRRIAFVPTMGFLHEGHVSLIREGRKRGDALVVSIFVNPIQFNQKEDFEAYPRDLERDRQILEDLAVDVLFCPEAQEMYPEGFQTFVTVEKLSEPLCGRYRPGHFRGVATVVTKLFHIVKPHVAIFGQKDFQQYVLIRRLVQDLNLDIEIVGLPTVREADGLACSSRNVRLSPEQRREGVRLFRALQAAQEMVRAGERQADAILARVREIITGPEITLEYASLCDPETLEEVAEVVGHTLLAVAAWVGKVRLIDNILLTPSD